MQHADTSASVRVVRRRAVFIALALACLTALPAAAWSAPQPDASPAPAPDAAPRPQTPQPTYTPPEPTYTPPEQTYTPPPPSRPRGPTPADPGTAGADLVTASGARLAAPTPKPQAEPEQAATPEPATAPAPESTPAPTATVETPPATEPAAPVDTGSAPPASVPETPVASVAETPVASTPAPASAPPPQPVAEKGGTSIPVDGAGLLVALLACGVVLAVRAFRHGQRRLAIPLAAFCGAYLVVVGGVFAGVANATPVPDFEATPGDGEVLLTWTPVETGTVRVLASTTPLTNCQDASARVVPLMTEASALDSALQNGVTMHYAACVGGEAVADSTTSATPTSGVDGEAPPPVKGLRVNSENARVRVRWTPPAVEDLAEVVVVRRLGARAPSSPKDGTVVYRGLARTVTDFPVSPRARVWYAAFALDDDDNVSTPVTGSLPRFDPPLYAPLDGAVIRNTQLFRWRRVAGASYYNVQIWRGAAAKKVVSTWTNAPTYVLRRKLAKGRYSWYVFPGFGPRSLARYGALLGSGTFVVR